MTFHFANTLYIINQEIITTPKLNKNPRDRLIFVAREHFDSPTAIFFPYFRESSEVFISLRVSKVCWDDAMFLREIQLISCTWCSSGARQARFTCISVQSTMTKSSSTSFCPRIWALKSWRCFNGSWKDTSIWFQTCWDVTISLFGGRDWSQWGFVRFLFPSFVLLPLRLSHWFITREQPLALCRLCCFHSNQFCNVLCLKLNFLGSDTNFYTARISAWRGVYPNKRTLGVCPGFVKCMVWFCSTRWESLLWAVLLH